MQINGLRAFAGCALLAAACSSQKEAAPAGPPANARRVDPATAGRVSGRVTIEGAVPQNPPLKMAADPYCEAQNPTGATFEHYVVDNGGLENVFVFVTDKLDYYFEVPTEQVTLDQKGCHYAPHVVGVRTGQTLVVRNSDDTMHNVHAMAAVNKEWTKSQTLKNIADERVFTAREVMVQFKCDVHNWMHAYVGVMEHPYFAVTRDGGKFELANLPAGTYTVEAWHEKLGTQTQQVTIGEKETKEISFSFKAAGAN